MDTQPNQPQAQATAQDTDFNELNRLADEGELTPDTLQQKLADYRGAIEQEFKASTEKNPDDVEASTSDFFKDNIPMAAAQLVWLAHNAESESVQINALKFIIQQGLADADRKGDPIQAVIDQLTKTKDKTGTPK